MQADKQKPSIEIASFRRGIIISIIAVVLIITGIILYNLLTNASRFSAVQVSDANKIDAYPTHADTNWYETRSIPIVKQSVPEDLQGKTAAVKPSAQNDREAQSAASINRQHTKYVDDDLLEAMKAPITSNQLINREYLQQSNTHNADQTAKSNDASASSHPVQIKSALQKPQSPYTLLAGAVIPAKLLTGVNSEFKYSE